MHLGPPTVECPHCSSTDLIEEVHETCADVGLGTVEGEYCDYHCKECGNDFDSFELGYRKYWGRSC